MDLLKEKPVFCKTCVGHVDGDVADLHLISHVPNIHNNPDREVNVSFNRRAGLVLEGLVQFSNTKKILNVFITPDHLYSTGIITRGSMLKESCSATWHDCALAPSRAACKVPPHDRYLSFLDHNYDPPQIEAQVEVENADVQNVGLIYDQPQVDVEEADVQHVGLLANVIWDYFV